MGFNSLPRRARVAGTRGRQSRPARAGCPGCVGQTVARLGSGCASATSVLLLQAFTRTGLLHPGAARSLTAVAFDELELMDETEVQASVTPQAGSATHHAGRGSQSDRTQYPGLWCAGSGFCAGRTQTLCDRRCTSKPLRDVSSKHRFPSRCNWTGSSAVGAALGPELRKLYISYCETLRGRGVVTAGYGGHQHAYAGARVGRGVARTLGHPVLHGSRRRLRPVGTARRNACWRSCAQPGG